MRYIKQIGVRYSYLAVVSKDPQYEQILEWLGESHPLARHLISREGEEIGWDIREPLQKFLWLSNPTLRDWNYSGNARRTLDDLKAVLCREAIRWWCHRNRLLPPPALHRMIDPQHYEHYSTSPETVNRTHLGRRDWYSHQVLTEVGKWCGHSELQWIMDPPVDTAGVLDKTLLRWSTRPRPLWVKDKVLRRKVAYWCEQSAWQMHGDREDYLAASNLWAEMYGNGLGNLYRVRLVNAGWLWVDIAEGAALMEQWVSFMEKAYYRVYGTPATS